MEVLGDLVGRDRRSGATALRAPAVGRSYDYRRFCTTAWKTGNFLRHLGVRGGALVAIADDPAPEAVLTLYGAACLGAVVRFGPVTDADPSPKVRVGPVDELTGVTVDPATKSVGYGDPPADPDVAYFERDVWSENPTAPPDAVNPTDPLVKTDDSSYSHQRVLEAAETVLDRYGIGPETTVATTPDASFTQPGTVVAGLVAPILAGGTVVLGVDADADRLVGESNGDVDPAAVLGET